MAARLWTLVLAVQMMLGLAVAGMCAAHRALSLAVVVVVVALVPAVLTGGLLAVSFMLSFILNVTAGVQVSLRASLQAYAGELWYFALSWVGMIAEPLRPDAPSDPQHRNGRPGGQPVLLLHGFACNRAVWRPLWARLRSAGLGPVHAVNLEPPCGDWRTQLITALHGLRSLERIAGGLPIIIVGHSMGGLVARALLETVSPARLAGLITIGSPHHGTGLARCLRALALRPEASGLRRLNDLQEGHWQVPLISLYSREDNLVAPALSALLRGARSHELRGLGHFGMLRSPAALQAVMLALGSLATAPPLSRPLCQS
jgi:pimeloyl-ACP methyl ester carboxylesterase